MPSMPIAAAACAVVGALVGARARLPPGRRRQVPGALGTRAALPFREGRCVRACGRGVGGPGSGCAAAACLQAPAAAAGPAPAAGCRVARRQAPCPAHQVHAGVRDAPLGPCRAGLLGALEAPPLLVRELRQLLPGRMLVLAQGRAERSGLRPWLLQKRMRALPAAGAGLRRAEQPRQRNTGVPGRHHALPRGVLVPPGAANMLLQCPDGGEARS
jgi:hypothetical protein